MAIDAARGRLRHVQADLDDVCGQAGALAAATDWRSRSADAYRAAVASWNTRLALLSVRLVLFDDDLARERVRAQQQAELGLP